MKAEGTRGHFSGKAAHRAVPTWIHQHMERIAEVLILAEPEETPRLETVRNQLDKIAVWVTKHRTAELSCAIRSTIGVLDGVAGGTEPVPAAALDVVRRAVNSLQAILCDDRDPRTVEFPKELDGPGSAVAAAPVRSSGESERVGGAVRRPEALHSDIDDAIFADFLSRQGEVVDELEELALELEKTPDDSIIKELKGLFHTLKGDSSVLGLGEVERACHACEDVIDAVPATRIPDLLLRVRDWLGSTFAYYGGQADRPEDTGEILDMLTSTANGGRHSSEVAPRSADDPEDRSATVPSEAAVVSDNGERSDLKRQTTLRESVKIDAERLDRLLDTIGELVIAESMVCQSREFNPTSSPELDRRRMQLDKITRALQVMSTSLRMVPVRPVFLRMARLVRDLAIRADKQIEFVMSGENTELDKAVVDRIGEPLLHVLRNAVDHGIESASERNAVGKANGGWIELRAFHRGGNIFIEVEDDGRGLDRAKILARARDRELLPKDAEPGDDEVFACVFEPGFSTAEKVTDVSGRGVGLDVVHRAVHELRGQVNLASTPGGGCLVSIRLPLSLAIIDGMVVSAGDERYIIPTLSVVRFIRPDPGQLSSVMDRGEMLAVEGAMLPLFRLHRLLEIEGASQDPCRALAVVVEDNGRRAAILVDALHGQQQIVIKGMGDLVLSVRGVAGGAIMPDGHVGLILDVPGLVALAHAADSESSWPTSKTRTVPPAAEGPADERSTTRHGKAEVHL